MILKDAIVLADGRDLSGDTNSINLEVSVADLDATTFVNDGAVERVGGLKDWSLNVEGFYNTAADADLFANIGDVKLFTVAADQSDGATAFSGSARSFKYEIGGAVGELNPFSLEAKAAAKPGLLKGVIALPRADYATSGTGVERQLGALSASQTLYAFVHVLSKSGTTPEVDVKVQSASSNSFTSPTDRITMSDVQVGSTVGTKTGSVTHTWWRVSYSITGTDPSFRMAIALAVV